MASRVDKRAAHYLKLPLPQWIPLISYMVVTWFCRTKEIGNKVPILRVSTCKHFITNRCFIQTRETCIVAFRTKRHQPCTDLSVTRNECHISRFSFKLQWKSSNILLSVRKFITSDMIPCRLFIEIVGFANVEKSVKRK